MHEGSNRDQGPQSPKILTKENLGYYKDKNFEADRAQAHRARNFALDDARHINDRAIGENKEVHDKLVDMMVHEARRAFPYLDTDRFNGHVVPSAGDIATRGLRYRIQGFLTQEYLGPVWIIQMRDVGDIDIKIPGQRDDPGHTIQMDALSGTGMTPKGKLFSFRADVLYGTDQVDQEILDENCKYDKPIDLAYYEVPDTLEDGDDPVALQNWRAALDELKRP